MEHGGKWCKHTNKAALSTLPLAGVGSMLTTLDVEKLGISVGPQGAQAADAAGYESVRLF
jgi:hypothetical protein